MLCIVGRSHPIYGDLKASSLACASLMVCAVVPLSPPSSLPGAYLCPDDMPMTYHIQPLKTLSSREDSFIFDNPPPKIHNMDMKTETQKKKNRNKKQNGIAEAEDKAKLCHMKKAAFLAAFAEVGVIIHAAEIANVNRHSHQEWLKNDPDGSYAVAFAIAEERAVQRMEQEARRRAIEGVAEPHFWKDQQVGTIQKYSDTLLIFMLKSKRPAVYRDNVAVEHSGSAGTSEMAALVALAIQAVADARRGPAIEAPAPVYVDAQVVPEGPSGAVS